MKWSERGLPVAERVSRLTTPVLLLLTPFVVFLRHHAYALHRPEALAGMLALVCVGLGLGFIALRGPGFASIAVAMAVAAFVDFQIDFNVPIPGIGQTAVLAALSAGLGAVIFWTGRRAITLIQVMAGVMLLSTLALPPGSLRWHDTRPGGAAAISNEKPPVLLHLILDEHIGVNGLSPNDTGKLRQELRSFLEGNRFSVFGTAYSEYPETTRSVGQVLDLAPRARSADLVAPAEKPFTKRLTRSRYLDWLGRKGYSIDVYQSDYLDFCQSAASVASCHTYASARLGVIQGTSLTSADRARLIAAAYLMRADFWPDRLRGLVPSALVDLPGLKWHDPLSVSPIATAAMLDQLSRDLRHVKRGHAVIAHLLLPHYPYIYDAQCRPLPPSQWLERYDPALEERKNTRRGRSLRYARYADQLRCTQRWIERLLDAIPEDVRRDAILILQGDHGSRITLNDPGQDGHGRAVESDYVATYSTLFAVRSASLRNGYSNRPSSISCILKTLVDSNFRSVAALDACTGRPVVFWRSGDERYAREPSPLWPHAVDDAGRTGLKTSRGAEMGGHLN